MGQPKIWLSEPTQIHWAEKSSDLNKDLSKIGWIFILYSRFEFSAD